jgi:hypothetical protein
MHVASAIEPSDLRLVPPLVVVVGDVARLVQVLDAVNEEP